MMPNSNRDQIELRTAHIWSAPLAAPFRHGHTRNRCDDLYDLVSCRVCARSALDRVVTDAERGLWLHAQPGRPGDFRGPRLLATSSTTCATGQVHDLMRKRIARKTITM